jgi:hypothetical protein
VIHNDRISFKSSSSQIEIDKDLDHPHSLLSFFSFLLAHHFFLFLASQQHSEPLNLPVGAAHKNLRSITEVDAMAEFLADAEMADREFMAEKQHVVILEKHSFVNTLEEANRQREKLELELGNRLTIPRRPPWNENTTKEELDRTERHSFLEWRRSLAVVEETEGVMMTPFEKNLEVWRQLWRVVEKSDIVVQIIDARDPLLFRSIDLENYVKQVDPNKVNMLLINKADLLTQAQRYILFFSLSPPPLFPFFSSPPLLPFFLRSLAPLRTKHLTASPSSFLCLSSFLLMPISSFSCSPLLPRPPHPLSPQSTMGKFLQGSRVGVQVLVGTDGEYASSRRRRRR